MAHSATTVCNGYSKFYYLPCVPSVPAVGPHNLMAIRFNGTAMIVSFAKLSLVEARRHTLTYFITYVPDNSAKREVGETTVAVPEGSTQSVITGLDPNMQYSVRMFAAADRDGTNPGPSTGVVTIAGLSTVML